MAVDGLMTIGQLASRTGVSIRALRRYTDIGLVYMVGRSPANYRLYDESAVWCVQVIGNLRRLGLTVSEIRRLAAVYLTGSEEPIGPHLDVLLGDVERRLEYRIGELEAIRGRLREFRLQHADALAGHRDLAESDPSRA
jgi:DNA-binding transcriptional MerR regulator